MSTILITGATGTVGREVANALNKSNVLFRVTTRRSEGTNHEQEVYLDFRRSESFLPALAGVEKLFLVRPSDVVDVEETFLPFVQAAQKQGVRQITFLSVMGAEYQPMIPHARIERAIAEAGIAYTFLRPSFFMQNLVTSHLNEIQQEQTLYIPAADSKTSLIDVRDIGEVGAKSLLDDQYWNKGYTLTGSEALTYYDVAQIMTEELGRPITYANPTPEQFKAHMLSKHVPPAFVQVMLDVYGIAAAGLVEAVTPDLAIMLGHAPKTVRDFVHDYRNQL
ncbi:NmrA family transcriptional regulator [Dictyobacter alpinus]|uniref:NmrA family transcriptional regulator n=1 Tax=Dictyobacter alpinus TaxID=2014873 RepID=A0A402B9T4_9CHLR|nr:SDR family oxidoreductase [Dictyobacter alpinus]GCE28062.1 NmrA family transcriptional regulator [Dictyobacter alpinus]